MNFEKPKTERNEENGFKVVKVVFLHRNSEGASKKLADLLRTSTGIP